ncbi:S8 family serine peptidase [Microcoleus sp. T3_B1]|uniref:S8 family serine peptidase n=1 Tax=Microcoleus sp. T3_B1 TaxID=3055425 RepID=UPI002FD4C043
MELLNFGGKKRKEAQDFGNSSKTKSRKRPKSFRLETIVTPSVGVGGWLHEFDYLHQLLGSLSLSDLDLPNFFADSGVCPIDPSGDPTNNLPPLIDFDPLGLYHDGIATQTPYNPGGAFETLPIAVIPVDPQSPNPNNPNAIRQLLDFPLVSQPLVGSIDTGVSADSPYLNYANIKKGRDYVGGDDNPLLKPGEGSEHGTFMLGIIDAINKTAPKWVGRAIDSGRWADSLVEFVDAAKASGQKNAIANLSLDLTQKNPDGSVTTRYELTPAERKALEYARQNGVLLVAAAGNDGGVMSVLGQASQEFDNIFTVGAGDINGRSIYSSYGRGLDIVADGGTTEHPGLSTVGNDLGTMAGTSVATAKVAGAASLVWAANPALNYRQVMEILKSTARDLGPSGWDDETGFGFLNTLAAVDLAKKTMAEVYQPTPWVTPDTWSGEGKVTPEERAAQGGTSFNTAPLQLSPNFTDSGIVSPAQPALYHTFTVTEPGYFRYTVNPTNGSTKLPLVSVVKADGKPGGFEFIPGEPSGVFNSVGVTIGDETFGSTKVQTPTSKTAAVFLDAGTYAVKVASGQDTSIKNYGLTTELIPDRSSAFSGSAQFRIPLQNNISGMFTSAPTSPELNVPAVSNQSYQYGIEVNDPVKFTLNSQSNIGYAEIEIRKVVGSGEQWESITTYSTDGSQPIDLNLNLNKGRYKIYVKTTVPLKGSVTPLVTDPDGSLATARNIGTLSSNQIKFSDSIGGSDKSDFYRFDVSQPSEVALYLKRLQGNSDIKLLDAQGKEIDKTYNPSGTNPSDVIFNTVNPGTYYVQVFSSNNANANYELKLDATPVASSGTPQSGGSSVSIGASPVPNTGGGSVSIGASPVPNTGGGSVNIGPSPVKPPVAPQPGQGGVPLNAGNFQYTAISNGVTTHYYTNGYLTIQPTGYKTWYGKGSSSSVATVQTLGKPTQVIPDANRQLGEFIGRYEYKGRLRTGDNTDGYYFAVKDRSLLNFALRNLGADASLKLYKVNPNASKSLIREAPAAGQGFDKLWSETLDTGNYYVEVNKGSATADTDYTMVLNLAKTLNDANQNNFNSQPNPFLGTFTGRTVISGNLSSSNPAKKSSTNAYDNDRYRLNINNLGSQSPNILRLGLNDLAPNTTAKVVVYDGNNQPVKEQLFYPGQNSPLEVSGLAEGPYFVGVEQVQGDTPYNLAVQLDQAGEDWSRVRNLGDLTGQRKEYEDFVGATRDGSDYYKFTIKDSRLLQLAPRLFDSDNPAGVKVELYDANKQLVGSQTFTATNPIYSKELAQGDYYVKVVPASANDTNYRLVVNLTAPGIVNTGNVTYSYNNPLFPDSSSSSGGSNVIPPANNQPQSNNNPAINLANFKGWAMPNIGVALRNSPHTNDKNGEAIPYGTSLNFDAWTYGDTVVDYKLGTPNNSWFRIAKTNYWVPSAYISGTPNGLPGNQQPNSANNSYSPIPGVIPPPVVTIGTVRNATDGSTNVDPGKNISFSVESNTEDMIFYIGDRAVKAKEVTDNGEKYIVTLQIPNNMQSGNYLVTVLAKNQAGLTQTFESNNAINVKFGQFGQVVIGGVNNQTPPLVGADSPSIPGEKVEEPLPDPSKDFSGVKGIKNFGIDRLKSRYLTNGSQLLSFDVLNFGYADGVIEVYNAKNELVEIRGFDGAKPPVGVVDFSLEALEKLYKTLFNGYSWGDPRKTEAFETTEVRNVVIPPGGSLKITKSSESALVYNLMTFGLDLFFNNMAPEDLNFQQQIFSKLAEEKVRDLVKPDSFTDNAQTLLSLLSGSWVNNINPEVVDKIIRIIIATLSEKTFEYILKKAATSKALKQAEDLIFAGVKLETLKKWVEGINQGNNMFLQILDVVRSQQGNASFYLNANGVTSTPKP